MNRPQDKWPRLETKPRVQLANILTIFFRFSLRLCVYSAKYGIEISPRLIPEASLAYTRPPYVDARDG